MQEENWFDKQFTLGLPLEDLLGLVERLNALPLKIEQALEGVPREVLISQPGGQWSVLQHIGHLSDLEELHEGRLDDFRVGVETLRAADLSNSKTEGANHNDSDPANLLDTFKGVRARFVGRLEELNADEQARSIMHPRLQKPMRPVDLAFFVTEHDAHHLAAIVRLCSGITGKSV